MKTLRIYILLLLILIGSCHVFAAPVTITAARSSVSAERSRLVFEVSARPNYILFTLSHPNRLVLDIKNATLAVKLNQHLVAKTPIKNMRSSNKQGLLRMVMDLKQPVTLKSFILPANKSYPYRLVIDLTNVNAQPLPKLTALKTSTPLAVQKAPLPVIVTPPHNPVKTRDVIIVIDPGHGGKDPGTTSYDGTHEKDVVFAIATDLQQALNSEPGFRAVLTRRGNYYIPLRGRLEIARQDKADMFISIHADAYQNTSAMGVSVFALSERGATSEAARWLAEKENRSELVGGANLPDNDNVLRSVLIDLSQTNTISESLQIGSSVLRQVSQVTLLHHERVEQAAFVVLKSPDIPSILVETGFLSTPRQAQQLKNSRYQRLLANAIMQGIKDYFIHYPPMGTSFSVRNANRSYLAQSS